MKNYKMILRAYKYRLYPDNEQKKFLAQNFGAVRFLWNQLVANFNSWSPEHKPEPVNEKILKDSPGNEWMHEVISYALQQKRMDFDEAKKQFFNKKRKTKLGRMKFNKIDRWIPSSKTCNCCGHKMESMELSIHEWVCPSCGSYHDRDVNAARNIKDQGFKELYQFSSAELAEYKHGEDVRRASTGAVFNEALSRSMGLIEIYGNA